MSVSNSNNCSKCDMMFVELDAQVKCDGCNAVLHNVLKKHKVFGTSSGELKCLALKNRNLKYFYDPCSNGLREIPELKLLINRLLTEVSELKNSSHSEEIIINEINERNIGASNLILYNVPESTSSVIADKITHDFNLVNNVIYYELR